MLYTVKDVSRLSGVTVKALHHYHKIGLLLPCGTTEAGYRLYGQEELERLQQILFYRELDFSLEEIGRLLSREPDRTAILERQEELLLLRKRRLETIIDTLQKSIAQSRKGDTMNEKDMFRGFHNEEEWKEALKEQSEHLKDEYGFDLLESNSVETARMNELASEAASFMGGMAKALQNGARHDDPQVFTLIDNHLAFLENHGLGATAEEFAVQTRFFREDDFHRNMLESQQTGLSYYLGAAAEAYAAR